MSNNLYVYLFLCKKISKLILCAFMYRDNRDMINFFTQISTIFYKWKIIKLLNLVL